jgi:hypothetical protein
MGDGSIIAASRASSVGARSARVSQSAAAA